MATSVPSAPAVGDQITAAFGDAVVANITERVYSSTAVVGTNWDGATQIIEQIFSASVSVSAANFSVAFPQAFSNGIMVLIVTVGSAGSDAAAQAYPVTASTTLSTLVGQAWSRTGAAVTATERIWVHAVGW